MKNSVRESHDKRTCWCNIRLTEKEHEALFGKLKDTTYNKLSDYLRSIIFNKPVNVKVRNQSLDEFMNELIGLRQELNYLGNNFNQVVKKLNSIPPSKEYLTWLGVSEDLQRQLLSKVGIIQVRIDQFSDKWLQS
ncbi:plasmid mobilization protein [Chitinophaga sancti]|uniref:plasmid mobilization protein n=1 Tax=Chitinophaga sancti TaxID=1004 RepID=UPI003F78B9DE